MLLTLTSALERILPGSVLLDAGEVPLSQAFQRVLRESVIAGEDRPAFDRSAMDGYAVGSPDAPSFDVLGEVAMGHIWPGTLEPHQAVRIFTGGSVPPGSVRVLPQEWVQSAGGRIQWDPRPGPRHIRCRGDDARRGQVLVSAGTRLRAPELALLAQEGTARPLVSRVPRMVHLVMGDELVGVDAPASAAGVRDSNSPLVAGLAAESGVLLVASERSGDDFAEALAVAGRLMEAEPDLLVVSGGAGPGERDLGSRLLRELGMDILFHGIDLRPGKPLLCARKGATTAFVMPGNPVSHWVAWHLVVRPFLDGLTGASPADRFRLPLSKEWRGIPDEREVWWPGRITVVAGVCSAEPVELASSGDLSGLSGARILLHFGRERHFPAGTLVEVLMP